MNQSIILTTITEIEEIKTTNDIIMSSSMTKKINSIFTNINEDKFTSTIIQANTDQPHTTTEIEGIKTTNDIIMSTSMTKDSKITSIFTTINEDKFISAIEQTDTDQQCEYYYYDKDNNYICTFNLSCPNEYPKLLIYEKKCIKIMK